MAGWEGLNRLLQLEIEQLTQEGITIPLRVLELAQKELNESQTQSLLAELESLIPVNEVESNEPNDLALILKDATVLIDTKKRPTMDEMEGAFLGRCIGCSLGKPLEVGPYFWDSTVQNPGWKQVKRWFAGANQYPIRDYVPLHSSAEKEGLYIGCPECAKDNLKGMETDDDIRYTIMSLLLLESYGSTFQPYEVGRLWHDKLPYLYVCTAETQAYHNFAQVSTHLGMKKEQFTKNDAHFVRTHHNPYREWIGAQIRIDGYGYAAAGQPLLAAQLAYQDASFSHIKNGIYGAMFFAALIASAFTCKDIDQCILQALEVIPKKSRLSTYLKRTIELAKVATSEEQLVESVWSYLLDFNNTHTINNACICVASILWGKGDFTTSIGTSVLFGLDTDCNGATVGSFMGALLGKKAIPTHWIAPLNDTLYANLIGFHPIAISEVARRFMVVANRLENE